MRELFMYKIVMMMMNHGIKGGRKKKRQGKMTGRDNGVESIDLYLPVELGNCWR